MAKWKKGQSGNPKGPEPMPQDVKAARQLTQAEVHRILNKYLYCGIEELQAIEKDPKTLVVDGIVAKIMLEARIKGDQLRLEWVWHRLIGKVPDRQINKNTHDTSGKLKELVEHIKILHDLK